MSLFESIFRVEISDLPQKKCGHLCSDKTLKIGVMSNDEIEDLHNFKVIEKSIYEDKRNILRIGSPNLFYWFERDENCRIERLMNSKSKFVVQILYYKDNDNITTVEKRLINMKEKFSSRFDFIIVKSASNISYIMYGIGKKKMKYQRTIIGYKKLGYTDTPFIEFSEKYDKMCDFTYKMKKSHDCEYIRNGN